MKNTIIKGASRGWKKDGARNFVRKGICGLFALLAFYGGHAPASAQAQAQTQVQTSRYTATEQANRETVRRAYAAWARGGTKFFDILAPNAVWTIKGSGKNAVTYRSKAALLKSIEPFQARLASPLVPTVRQIMVDGDQVIILWDGRAPTKDGQVYRNSYAWFFKMKNGKAVEVTAFLDLPAYDDIVSRPVPRAAKQ